MSMYFGRNIECAQICTVPAPNYLLTWPEMLSYFPSVIDATSSWSAAKKEHKVHTHLVRQYVDFWL